MQSEGGFGRAQHTITFAPLPQRERSNEEIEPRIVRMIADNANAFFIRVLREIRGSLSRIFRTRRYDCDTAMDIPYDEILAVVRKPGDPTDAFKALWKLGKDRSKSDAWDAIKTPNVEMDVWEATAWLYENVLERRPTGVYFGLDTLNERGGFGMNVSVGMSFDADPKQLTSAWGWGKCEDGTDHLIKGMCKAHNACKKAGISTVFADYLFFFGYSASFSPGHWSDCPSGGTPFSSGASTTAAQPTWPAAHRPELSGWHC